MNTDRTPIDGTQSVTSACPAFPHATYDQEAHRMDSMSGPGGSGCAAAAAASAASWNGAGRASSERHRGQVHRKPRSRSSHLRRSRSG